MPRNNQNIVSIYKADKVHNTITYVVLVPEVEDRNGDVISADEIIKTAHEFMLNLQEKAVNVNHKEGTDIEECFYVESWIAPVDIEVEGGYIPEGSWLVAIKMPDNLYQDALDGKITGISMEGSGISEKISE